MTKIRSFTVVPALPESLKGLEVIANNMYWCWTPEFVDIFKRIDSNLWSACSHNPVKLLGKVSQQRFDELSQNKGFVSELNMSLEKLNNYLQSSRWFDNICSESGKPVIAYFSAEFGIHESLPIYSGGLGGLAGDHLKSASDLGISLVGVGLMYQKGYFRQYLNVDGWQQELYTENDLSQMPVSLVTDSEGQAVEISVKYPGRDVKAQIWKVEVGKVKLYLLDTNIVSNSVSDRMITSNLYGGDRELRVKQEILLGIGGLRALNAIGIYPSVCHMNEGHAAFMALERMRQLIDSNGMSFEEALEATKSGNVFTIHTPVKAGLDEFSVELIDKYMSSYYPLLQIDRGRFLSLGRIFEDDQTESFKMPILAIKLSSFRNGVSKLHGDVSRAMWASLWPRVPVEEVPIDSVTNGVHVRTWISSELSSLYERYFGPEWAEEMVDNTNWTKVDQIPDEEIWRAHQRCKDHLIAFARKRLKAQLRRRGTFHTELNRAEEVLDPEALTIGFARRFATYKRGSLLLREPERLVRLLTNKERPVQIIFAGKAHPKDSEGKEIIRQIIHFAAKHHVRRRVVFLEDYDINVARELVSGVDIWLNTPRRPMEASGTSGMKAAINGAINLSVLDGWWDEAYDPEIGWSIGAGEKYDDTNYQDMVESQALYKILENEVIPLFYTRTPDQLPRRWVYRMKKSIKAITPTFNTHRMVREYTKKFYLPAAEKWKYFSEDNWQKVRDLCSWQDHVRSNWNQLEIKDVQFDQADGAGSEKREAALKVGSELEVRALIKLGNLSPEDLAVELYNGPVDSWGKIDRGSIVRMSYEQCANTGSEHWFTGLIKCQNTGRHGAALRIRPSHKDLFESIRDEAYIVGKQYTNRSDDVQIRLSPFIL